MLFGKAVLSRYISFNYREILYIYPLGNRKLKIVYRPFGISFPIDTNIWISRLEMLDALKTGDYKKYQKSLGNTEK